MLEELKLGSGGVGKLDLSGKGCLSSLGCFVQVCGLDFYSV